MHVFGAASGSNGVRGRNWYDESAPVPLIPNNHSHPAFADLFVRIDAGAREGLQQQVYASIRRGIFDGVLAPGGRLPSSRALAQELCVSRTTTLLAYEQLLAEGYLAARHGSGTFVAEDLPDDLPQRIAPRRAARSRHPRMSRRGAVLAGAPRLARRLPGPPCAFRLGVPALDLFPIRLWSQIVGRRLKSMTPAQLDYSDPAGFRALREAIAEHVQATRGTTCTADQVLIVAGA